jgi:hypothetical protein
MGMFLAFMARIHDAVFVTKRSDARGRLGDGDLRLRDGYALFE